MKFFFSKFVALGLLSLFSTARDIEEQTKNVKVSLENLSPVTLSDSELTFLDAALMASLNTLGDVTVLRTQVVETTKHRRYLRPLYQYHPYIYDFLFIMTYDCQLCSNGEWDRYLVSSNHDIEELFCEIIRAGPNEGMRSVTHCKITLSHE